MLEVFINITFLICTLVLLIVPYLVLKKIRSQSYRFLNYIFFMFCFAFIFIVFFSWWQEKSNGILLTHYGYNFNGMSQSENYTNVASVHKEKVQKIEESMDGIGWPLKAMFAFIYYFIYIILVYMIFIIMKYFKIIHINSK